MANLTENEIEVRNVNQRTTVYLLKYQAEMHTALENVAVISQKNENLVLINDPTTELATFGTEKNVKILYLSDIILNGIFVYVCKYFS